VIFYCLVPRPSCQGSLANTLTAFGKTFVRRSNTRFGFLLVPRGVIGPIYTLPQQAQTIESVSGHTYIRKRISLTFFVKKLILWSERLFQTLLSDATYFVYRAVTFFNEIDLHPYSSYYLKNTVKLIRRSSSIINKYLYPISPRDVKQKAPPNG